MAPTKQLLTRPRSTITISPESMVELSKSVLLLLECDTLVPSKQEKPSGGMKTVLLPCGQTLNCWTAFYRHQHKHCATCKSPRGGRDYVCRLNKCNAKLHLSSLMALKSHIELFHLKHLSFPCPFTACRDVGFPGSGNEPILLTFSRTQQLVQHLETQHGDLIGQAVDVHSDVLLHRWEPFSPVRLLPRPPPLPLSNDIHLGGLFVEPIIIRPTPHLAQLISDESPSLHIRHLPKTPHHRMLRHPTLTTRRPPSPSHDNNISGSSEYEFANLPEYHPEDNTITPPGILEPPWFALQPIHNGLPRRDLVRPLYMRRNLTTDTPPPPSISFDVLKKQVFGEMAPSGS
ncbi:hypothetical protein C8F04DRAFT_1095929 [Mycena alexandri]|uniref:C2H2-type domain-containing protein n=1 Tax=Mycena alexandri TaxID=1745969 RepID=A0AAD6SY94_9AGAR|nr:hypothetical protein C8F04DRAFT_1095929 [Mycena alexandri]